MPVIDDIGLPAPILRALENDGYDPGLSDITATGLLTPPRVFQLRKQHRVSWRASQLIPSLLGKAFHAMVEKHAAAGEVAEVRLYAHMLGWLVGGEIDLQVEVDGSTRIIDYKVVKIDALELSAGKWEEQLNIYRWLCHANGKLVSELEIVAIMKDWREGWVGSPGYPAAPVAVVPVAMWPIGEAEAFVEARVAAHQRAQQDLPLCSDEERWKRPDRWRLDKKLYATEDEAVAARGARKAKVTRVPSKPIMCIRNYCGVSEFCSQFQKEKEDA